MGFQCREVYNSPNSLKSLRELPFVDDASKSFENLSLIDAWRDAFWQLWMFGKQPVHLEQLLARSREAEQSLYASHPDFSDLCREIIRADFRATEQNSQIPLSSCA